MVCGHLDGGMPELCAAGKKAVLFDNDILSTGKILQPALDELLRPV
jgi:hypothetical protein